MDIISAFAEGKTIQYKTDTGRWHDLTENEGLPLGALAEEPNKFRIKPEQKFRPFKDAEECWAEMQKHQPFGWVKTGESIRRLITLVDVDRIQIGNQNLNWTYAQVFKAFIFMDGQPFGVKVEE